MYISWFFLLEVPTFENYISMALNVTL